MVSIFYLNGYTSHVFDTGWRLVPALHRGSLFVFALAFGEALTDVFTFALPEGTHSFDTGWRLVPGLHLGSFPCASFAFAFASFAGFGAFGVGAFGVGASFAHLNRVYHGSGWGALAGPCGAGPRASHRPGGGARAGPRAGPRVGALAENIAEHCCFVINSFWSFIASALHCAK